MDGFIPEVRNGPAHEDGAEEGPCAVKADDGPGDEDCAASCVGWEDSKVLE